MKFISFLSVFTFFFFGCDLQMPQKQTDPIDNTSSPIEQEKPKASSKPKITKKPLKIIKEKTGQDPEKVFGNDNLPVTKGKPRNINPSPDLLNQ